MKYGKPSSARPLLPFPKDPEAPNEESSEKPLFAPWMTQILKHLTQRVLCFNAFAAGVIGDFWAFSEIAWKEFDRAHEI